MKRSGTADLPLHYGYVPQWLYERMSKLGLAVVEVLLGDYGKDEVVRRMSDPFWFQCFGAVMGMDWHSSGVTTSVMGVLKRVVNPNAKSLGIYICGGKGKFSKETPNKLLKISETTGLNGNELIREEAERIFKNLSENGKITMELEETFWGAYFGMLEDQFGIEWMINYDDPAKVQPH